MVSRQSLLRALIVTHRWLGVTLCSLFLIWFVSGIGMMYWGMPAMTLAARLAHLGTLDPSRITVSPAEAAQTIGFDGPPNQIRLTTYDGRPAYRFGGDAREGTGGTIVYADTGEEQWDASPEMRDRAAVAWAGQRIGDASVEEVTEPDQWIVGNRLRNLRPLWKYSWPSGDQVYVDEFGEVRLHTTTASRLQAYASAIPHWLYFTPLRANQPFWIRFTTYSAMIGTAGAIVGVVIGLWMYSPRKKYRHAQAPSRVPYRGQKRLHTVLGLVFGAATVTWTFSGSLAFLPFPQPQRAPTPSPQALSLAPGQRGGGGEGISLAATLRGRVTLDDFAALHPRDLLATHAALDIREVTFTSFAGRPLYAVVLGDGTTRVLDLDGAIVPSLDRGVIERIARSVAPNPQAVEIRTVDQYDAYYLDRTREQPLPVMLALMHDGDETRYYIDPKTASVVRTYSNRNSARRWLYNGLHSFNFPWLYNHRPLWDIVVITFMLGGTALCGTAVVLALRAVGRKLRQVARRLGRTAGPKAHTACETAGHAPPL